MGEPLIPTPSILAHNIGVNVPKIAPKRKVELSYELTYNTVANVALGIQAANTLVGVSLSEIDLLYF